MDGHAYLKIFVALYVLLNPLEGLPIFLARTQNLQPRVRLNIGRTAALAVTCIMLVAVAAGRGVLQLVSISIGDLTTAGGYHHLPDRFQDGAGTIGCRRLVHPNEPRGTPPLWHCTAGDTAASRSGSD